MYLHTVYIIGQPITDLADYQIQYSAFLYF